MTGLRLDRIVKEFPGNVRAVDDVSLAVDKGKFLVLLGPSGCGKTTLLRCIAGFEQPNQGSIWIGDRVVADAGSGVMVPPEKRALGMVFQSYAVWPHLTVLQNVAYPLQIRRVPRKEIELKVQQALELVKLGHLAHRYPNQLSGGQQQRVALARSLVAGPDVLLLDEPLSNLDARLRDVLRFELKEIQRQAGVTAVYVTHDQAEAVVLGDLIAVMNNGVVEQCASPEEIFRRPATRFVAEFLGFSNIFRASVASREASGTWLQVGAAGIPQLFANDQRFSGQDEVGVSLRAECLRLSPEDTGRPNQWRAQVTKVTFLGTHVVYELAAGETRFNAVEQGVAMRHRAGSTLYVSIDPDDIAVFRM